MAARFQCKVRIEYNSGKSVESIPGIFDIDCNYSGEKDLTLEVMVQPNQWGYINLITFLELEALRDHLQHNILICNESWYENNEMVCIPCIIIEDLPF